MKLNSQRAESNILETKGNKNAPMNTIMSIATTWPSCSKSGERKHRTQLSGNSGELLRCEVPTENLTFEKYRLQLLNESNPVERYSGEAVKKVKSLEKMERRK